MAYSRCRFGVSRGNPTAEVANMVEMDKSLSEKFSS